MTGPGLFPDPHGEQGVLGDGVNSLDVAQEFAPATSYEVRGELQRMVERDLLGPWDGPEERFAPGARGPRDRYLVGMLGPKPALKSARDSADRVPDTEPGVSGDGEADLPEIVTPQNLGRMWASSMGLTFAVAADVDVLHAVVEWGSYDTEQAPAPDGRVRAVWHRVPVRHEREVRLDGERSYPIPLVGDDRAPEVYLAVEVRPRDGQRVVRLTLVNAQQEPDSRPDKAWLYQSRITVTALDGAAAVFAPVDDPADGGPARTTPRSSTCGCSTATSAGTPSATTSPPTRTSPSPGPGPRGSSRRPGCRATTCPPPSPPARWAPRSCRWTSWRRPTRLRCGAVSRRSPTATRAGSTNRPPTFRRCPRRCALPVNAPSSRPGGRRRASAQASRC